MDSNSPILSDSDSIFFQKGIIAFRIGPIYSIFKYMIEITIIDENGTPLQYTYNVVPELYNGLPVDQFEVRAKGDR